MSTRIQNNVMVRQSEVPFHVLVNEEMSESEKTISHGRDAHRFKNIVDRFVGNLRKHRRYIEHGDYKHERLSTTVEEGEESCTPKRESPQTAERSSSLEKINDLCRGELFDFPSSALMGRRRSRSDSDLIACEIFARRRAAICEEMERNIMMENGVTLRKCRKNLVLNQILENLSLL